LVWTIEFSETAVGQLRKIDRQAAKRIVVFMEERIAGSDDPRRSGKALTGDLGALWRYRVGDYRVVCEIREAVLRVLVVRIGHRKEVYRPR
jgi:mRNA interferase RelE/StbE